MLAVWGSTWPSNHADRSFAEWELESDEPEVEESGGRWADVLWHPFRDLLATAGGRSMIQLWSAGTSQLAEDRHRAVPDITHATWQPGGDLLLTSSFVGRTTARRCAG